MTAATTRWTPRKIRNATPFPKPVGAITAALHGTYGLTPLHGLLAYFANHADLLERGPTLAHDETDIVHRGEWLVVPVNAEILDALASFGAQLEDLEDGDDTEPEESDNDVETEPDDDSEPSVVRPEGTDRFGLADDDVHATLVEQQLRYRLSAGGSLAAE